MQSEDRKPLAYFIFSAVVAIAVAVVQMRYPDFLPAALDWLLRGCGVAVAACVIWLFYEHLGENKRLWWYQKRITSLLGMIVCGIGFVGFSVAHFWPSRPQAVVAPAIVPSPLIGTIQFVNAVMIAEVNKNTGIISARIQVNLINNSDELIKYHAITAGNINGRAFAAEKVQFDGIAYGRQNFSIVSNRISRIEVKNETQESVPFLAGWYEYELFYKFANEANFSRHTARQVQVDIYDRPDQGKIGDQTIIPLTVVTHNPIEE